MSEPKISVIIPVYNVENELERCLKSVQGQTYQNIEIILVDDGSTDSSPVICDAYARKDERIRVLHKTNGGLSDARNHGLLKADGDFVLYVDSDDFIEPDACSRLIGGAAEGVDLIAGTNYFCKDQKEWENKREGFFDGEVVSSRDFIIRSVQKRCFWSQAWGYMYRRSFLIRNDLFFRKGVLFEDMDLAPRLFMCADKICVMDFPFYHYVYRPGSITASLNTEKKVRDSIEIMERWKEMFEQIEDTELQKYLYDQLVFAYIGLCRSREIRGWHIKGFGFPFAVSHAVGLRSKARVIKFELKSVFRMKI